MTIRLFSSWNEFAINYTQYTTEDFFDLIKKYPENFSISFTSSLFEEIHKSIETKNWVDIEEIFYKQLTQGSRSNIKRVNDELENIKNKLIEYLQEIQKSISKDIIRPDITAKILEEVQEKDIAIKSKNNNPYLKQTLSDILLLNFNYTSVADMYLPTPNRFQSKTNKFSLIHIHGKLEEPQNIIFGYGNEDERFKNILNRNDNEYLKHIKSIRYSETDNYRKLLQFIESGYYQVYIMGHSCGPSDGTLLNTLFEHKYCVGIKPFYHKKADGTDNYMEITQNILRNFTDMKLMRDRVVNKTYCECLKEESNHNQ